MSCEKHVYFRDHLLYRTDDEGVDFVEDRIRIEFDSDDATEFLSEIVIEDEHRDGKIVIGATGRWLKQVVGHHGNLFMAENE